MVKGESRSYVVGLPVLVTVWDDGTVVYDVDTGEAGHAIGSGDANWPEGVDEHRARADGDLIEADHKRRMERGEA